MLTSSGMNDCTPTGTFYLMEKGRLSERGEWTWFQQYQCWVKYATRIYKGYMFHSLPFAEKDESTMIQQMVDEFGMPTSHGCMRLRVDDARFIAKECLVGTKVTIYKDTEKKEDLRKLLHISSYTGEDGMTYAEFLGYSENALGSGSSGVQVEDLQCRLSDLGYYGGEITGRYDTETVMAVKKVQKDLGIAQNGITTEELQNVLFSDEAPVSAGEVSLDIGRSGPVVEKLQQALKDLGCYNGEVHGIYDMELAEAVSLFQGACGYVVNGVADAQLQQCIYYQLEKLNEAFDGKIPPAEVVKEEVTMATLDSENNIIIRAKATTESDNLGKLKDGDVMMVNAVEDNWANITTNAVTGYVMKKYLEPFKQDNVVLTYEANGVKQSIGHTMAEYAAGAQKAADEFAAYFASEQYASAALETVHCVTVNTGSDDVKLNLRSIPDASGEILAEIPNGTSLRVVAEENGYVKVGFDEQIGYLLDDYLTHWEGTADEVVSTEQAEISDTEALLAEGASESIQAIVIRGGDEDKVDVYAEASADSESLGKMPVGQQVTVLSVNGGWALIELEGRQGYIPDANLQFELLG